MFLKYVALCLAFEEMLSKIKAIANMINSLLYVKLVNQELY